MKKSIFTLALAFIALFGFNTVSAQSMSNYSGSFIPSTGTLTLNSGAKIGGFGKGTTEYKVTIFLEIESTVDCTKKTAKGEITNEFKRESQSSHWAPVSTSKTGASFLTQDIVTSADPATAVCPPGLGAGWTLVDDSGQRLVRAYYVIEGKDKSGNIKTSGEQDLDPMYIPGLQ